MIGKKNLEQKYCCGCGLCSDFCQGREDERGYYRPDDVDFQEKFDVSLCYCNHLNDSVKNGLWGKCRDIFFSYSTDEMTRKAASSGGILTTVACYLLESKKVDNVIQVAAGKDDPMQTKVVENACREEVLSCAGSRYTASAALKGLISRLKDGKRYAVIAKPCDIRVLREFLKKNPEYRKQIRYLLSFFCGGTPSYQANERLLEKMDLHREELTSFQYRGNGWPGKTTGMDCNGKVAQVEYEESWGNTLGRDLQEICRFCWEGVGEAADISCGDAWYLEDGCPSFEERDGRNVVLVRSKRGQALLEEMISKGLISYEKLEDMEELKMMQPGHLMRKAAMFSRVSAMKVMGKSAPRYKMWKIMPYARYLTPVHNVKMFGGTVKRILAGKID